MAQIYVVTAAQGAQEDPFGKKVFPFEFGMDEALYYAAITPSIHFTMGGLEISRKAQVG